MELFNFRPTPSQVRRELIRRSHPGRQYTPCKTIKHKVMQRALRKWEDEALVRFIRASQNRLSVPSALTDPCSCGGCKPISYWD